MRLFLLGIVCFFRGVFASELLTSIVNDVGLQLLLSYILGRQFGVVALRLADQWCVSDHLAISLLNVCARMARTQADIILGIRVAMLVTSA